MRKISLTAIYRKGLYISSIIALIFLFSVSALAKSNCDTNASPINPAILTHSGIGGTGTTQSGIGGTGLHDGGTGGTGNTESGIGGTGNVANEGGIGGTGTTHSDIGGTGLHDGGTGSSGNPEGGIGGTGNVVNEGGIGGTGIIGVITGFASICVNGIEIHYDNNTPISVDGRLSTARDLAVGQVIAARALGKGQELTAQSIAVIHAVVGPIGSLNVETKEMRILGQSVQVDSSRDHSNFSNLKTGDWVQVSGHRLSNGTIAASRIETAPLRAEARLNGHVTQTDTLGFEINGTRVNYDAKLPEAGITQGMEVQVTGHWDGANLRAQQILAEPTRQSIGNVEHVVIEGYVHALSGKELNLSNRIVALDPNTQIAGDVRGDLKQDQRIQISGRIDANQRINAERIELTHGSPVQIQERIDRDQTDGGSKDKKNSSDNESDAQSSIGKNQSHNSGDSDDNKGSLKKEADIHSGKDRSSGSEQIEKPQDNREPNSSGHHSADKPERPLESGSSDRSTDHRDSLRDIDIPDRVRDHSGHHDRHIDR